MSRKAHITVLPSGMRLSAALVSAGIEACSMVWVERNVIARAVTEDEAVKLRNERARRLERLCPAELRKVIYVPPARNVESHRRERELVRDAYMFVNGLAAAVPQT